MFVLQCSLSWNACNKLNKIWRSNLGKTTKIQLFRSLIEPILLYRSETQTLNTRQTRKLDGNYTNMLRRVQNIHWSEHRTLREIYSGIPSISNTLKRRRLCFAGHCYRAKGEVISDVLLWKRPLPIRSRKLTYTDMLSRDTGMNVDELGKGNRDRGQWAKNRRKHSGMCRRIMSNIYTHINSYINNTYIYIYIQAYIYLVTNKINNQNEVLK